MPMTQRPPGSLSDRDFMRYSRQLLLPEVSESGQQRLFAAHIAIIGLGGLGQLAAQYLAAAGVGRLTLIDGDRIELSNLPRQLLYCEADLGLFKAEVAANKLQAAHGCLALRHHCLAFDADNAGHLLAPLVAEPHALVLDCTDNFLTRQRVNQACIERRLSLVSASVAHFQGQLFCLDGRSLAASGCYHCLFPADTRLSQSCSTSGVLGPAVGVMASMQALQALNLLLDINDGGYLHRFDAKSLHWQHAKLTRDPDCPVCSPLWS
ncbi:HesA/MoeB/ThiF family protein [Shewanella sp. AS16]|uniref:HesA/MoeB/ThiF family protein n=1 Tax=Shewanella sp. AS16 TaxID=2907625 RepID=UPI003FA38527